MSVNRKLDQFRHEDETEKDDSSKKVTRSVLIEKQQQDFLNSESINLSKLVRHILKRLMSGDESDL